MCKFLISATLGLAALSFATFGTAQARPHRHHHHGHYGVGRHDLTPHWHQTQTPFGNVYWYGNGLHDLVPHHHSHNRWGGVRSYSYTPFGRTKSYNGYPSYYRNPYWAYYRYGWGW